MQLDCIIIRTALMDYDLTLASLRDKGYRITKVRREIVNLFSHASRPLSAKKIGKKLAKSGLTADKTTVYRELQFLLKNNYLVEVYLNPAEVSYESSELSHHHHLICESCGSINNVTECLVSNLKENVYKKQGFNIKKHTLEFYGICSSCENKFNKIL